MTPAVYLTKTGNYNQYRCAKCVPDANQSDIIANINELSIISSKIYQFFDENDKITENNSNTLTLSQLDLTRFSKSFALMQVLMRKLDFFEDIRFNAQRFTVCRLSSFQDLDKKLVEKLNKLFSRYEQKGDLSKLREEYTKLKEQIESQKRLI
jgi:hypothetical protein